MKYRIKQIGDKYYPQRKAFGFWWNIHLNTCTIKYGECIPNKVITLCFPSLERASRAIVNYEHNYLKSFRCRKHTVISVYDEQREQYYYVDLNHPRIYSDNSEQVCEEISELLDARDAKRKHDKKVVIHEFTED